MQSKLMLTAFTTVILYGVCTSCSILEPILDYPMSFFDDETGETTEVPLGDVIADQSGGVAGLVGNALGGVNPLLGLLGAGGAAALLSGARRKRKAARVAQAVSPAEEPEVKG